MLTLFFLLSTNIFKVYIYVFFLSQVKLGKCCISSMKVWNCPSTGKTKVWYFPTHSHDLQVSDIQHHPMSSETSHFIEEQIAIKAALMDILRTIQQKAKSAEEESDVVSKDVNVTVKLIRERMRKKNMASLLHSDDAQSVRLLADKLMTQDPDIVLIYKPLGEPCVVAPADVGSLNEQSDVFMFGFQTKEQQKLMIEGCEHILVVDETHCTNQYDYLLLNMLVVDANRNGWPVAHLIASKSDENTVKHFFSALNEKCPNLEINCVITDDDLKLINSMNAGFQTDLRHLLCKRHLFKTFRKQLGEKAPKHLVDEMFVGLKILVNTRNSNTFGELSQAFIAKYNPTAPKFIEYFLKYLEDGRVQKWPMCYRNFAHQSVDTTGHVESFHRRLKNDYMHRKPNKRVDKLIEMLLVIASDDSWKRKRKETFGLVQSLKSLSHEKGIAIPDTDVHYLVDNIWEIKSSQPDVPHEVVRLCEVCTSDHCIIKCTSASCINLCSHMYYCSCLDPNPLCKHIHKLHCILTRGTTVPVNENPNNDIEPTFSQPIHVRSINSQAVSSLLFRDKQNQKFLDNLKTLVQTAETDSRNWSAHLLCKLNADIDDMLKNIKTSTSTNVSGMSQMTPTATITSTQKLQTQDSQMLPFRRLKKRKKAVDPAVQSLRKKAVLEDLSSYIPSNQINESEDESEDESETPDE